jgi:hypothetical protein
MSQATIELLADSSQIKTATKDLNSLNAAGVSAEKAQKGIQTSSAKASSALGNLSRNAGMAGIQVQQFVGQIQGGQSALLALSQQGADLGLVLGRAGLGAAIGITATAISFLLPVLMNASADVEELRDRIKELGDTSEATVGQIRFLAQENEKEIEKLSKSNEGLGESLVKAREELELMQKAGTGLDKGQFAVPRSAEENQLRYADAIAETKEEIVSLAAEIDTNNQEIINLSKDTATLGDESDKTAKKTASLTQSMQAQIIALESGAQAAEVYAVTQRAIADGTQKQLPNFIALINRKYELKKAVEDESEAWKTLEARYDDFLSVVAAGAKQNKADEKRFKNLKQQIVLQQQQITLDNEQYEIRRNLLALGDGATQAQIDEVTALTEQMQALRFEAELVGASLESSFANIGNNALSGLSDGLAEALVYGEDFNETIKSITGNILTGLVSAVIEYGTRQAAMYALDAAGFVAAETTKTAAVTTAIGVQTAAAVGATGTVATAQIGAATAITAAMAPAAAATSIATAGAAPAAAAPIALGTIGTIIAALVGGVALGSVFGRATGGQMAGNTPYLVGERGPELFTPNSSGGGRITPFNQLMNQAGQQNSTTNETTYLNLNISGLYETPADMIIANRDLIIGLVADYKRRRGEAF